jgi:cytidylate kinase
LSDTRVALLEEIWEWIQWDAKLTTRIFWLTGVASAGKSTIAHTVAKRCHEAGLLASSFFFKRDTAEETTNKLFSTIARGLAHFDKDVARQISRR